MARLGFTRLGLHGVRVLGLPISSIIWVAASISSVFICLKSVVCQVHYVFTYFVIGLYSGVLHTFFCFASLFALLVKLGRYKVVFKKRLKR